MMWQFSLSGLILTCGMVGYTCSTLVEVGKVADGMDMPVCKTV